MSVSKFTYAVYSGSVWNEWVELDDELFLVDEGEKLYLSILKYFFIVIISFSFSTLLDVLTDQSDGATEVCCTVSAVLLVYFALNEVIFYMPI